MRALALAACLATPASAETLDQALASILGREVTVEGHIGADPLEPNAILFRTADGAVYPVVFDAGREARKQLPGCKFQLFGGTPCRASVKAEIARDGAKIVLVIFEVTSIAPPAAL